MILLVFALDAATGASFDRVFSTQRQANPAAANSSPPRQPDAPRFVGPLLPPLMGQMQDELKLTEEQIVVIREIMEETRREFNPQRFEECPGFKETRLRIQSRINGVLNPEQQILFKEFTARREAEMSTPPRVREPR